MKKKFVSILLTGCLVSSIILTGCSSSTTNTSDLTSEETTVSETKESETTVSNNADQTYIEETLNLANNENQEWTYDASSDAWILSITSAVAYPEIEDQQGVSVCVPGAYVTGIDTDQDKNADVTSDSYSEAVKGSLIINYDATITSTNGQVYTAATAPVILNTGAAGYGSSTNTLASTTYAKDGYINIACGNRGKQDTATDDAGNTYYTGDAPSCLVDQKNATRFVKYNILLGNLPGSVDYFVSTGGSGGGAHASMFSATSNNSDYYDYEIEAGAVGVYKNTDGTYTTSVVINDTSYEISDGAWGCIAYSAITSLSEADMAMAFEYYLNTSYDFNTPFQAQVAEYLSTEYMEYINTQNLSVEESKIGFDLNKDGDQDDTIALSIEYDITKYADTNGYGGTYLDLYLAEFTQNLQWYLDNLDYSEGWTWFDADGNVLSNEQVSAMTSSEKATAFLEGCYAKGNSSKGMGGAPDGAGPGGNMGTLPDGTIPDGTFPGGNGEQMEVGTPDSGTTQSAGSGTDSSNYATYEEMVQAYQTDIDEISAGDEYGNNIVSLYNPLNYIGAETTENPTWVRIMMGASEGDMSMFSSLNLQISFLNVGVDATIEWQWDGGHVPSETLGSSFSLYVDQMYGEHVENATTIEKAAAIAQTENGTATEATGTDITSWISYTDTSNISFTLADVAAYRTANANKATPGFDVIDYGQEDYVFGNSERDARHWNAYLLEVFTEYQEVLEPLFNISE